MNEKKFTELRKNRQGGWKDKGAKGYTQVRRIPPDLRSVGVYELKAEVLRPNDARDILSKKKERLVS